MAKRAPPVSECSRIVASVSYQFPEATAGRPLARGNLTVAKETVSTWGAGGFAFRRKVLSVGCLPGKSRLSGAVHGSLYACINLCSIARGCRGLAVAG